jgi:hypothetical protein
MSYRVAGGHIEMRLDELKERLTSAGIVVVEEARDGNNTGYRLRLDCDAILNLYDSGVSLQKTFLTPFRNSKMFLGRYLWFMGMSKIQEGNSKLCYGVGNLIR